MTSDHEKARDLMRRLVEVANEDGSACIGCLGEWGHEAVAVIMTLAVSVFAFVRLSILRGWDWWSTP